MEDSDDTRRGTPMLTGTGRQGLSWPGADMHYQCGSGNFARGTGPYGGSSEVQRIDEASESWHEPRPCMQDLGRGPECCKHEMHNSSSGPSNIVVSYSYGAQTPLRTKTAVALQGQWNSLQGLTDRVDISELGDMDADANLSMGLSKGLGLSEAPTLPGHMCTGVNLEYSQGISGISCSSSSNLYSDQISGQATNINDYTRGRGYGQDAAKGFGRARSSAGLSLTGRPTRLARNWTYDAARSPAVERSSGEVSESPVTHSLPMNRQGRDGQLHLNGSKGNFTCLPNPLTASSTNMPGASGEGAMRGVDSQLFLSSGAVERVQVEVPTLTGSTLGSLLSNPCTSYDHGMSTSRASTCKRKSCPSSLLASSSCKSGSPNCSGSRNGNSVRFTRGCSTGRRMSGTVGCMSASDAVASTSAVLSGTCSETLLAASAVVEPRPRKSLIARDGDSPGSSSAAKASPGVVSAGASGPRGVNSAGQMDHLTTSRTQSPFERGVRRAIPELQPDTCFSQTVSVADCSSNTDLVSENGDILMQSSEHLIASGGGCRSGSQLVSSSRNGSTVSGIRNDHIFSSSFGERLSHRYPSSSNRNMIPGASGSVDRIDTESRLRVQNYLHNSANLPSSFGTVAGHSSSLVNPKGSLHSGIASRSSPSRLPSYSPAARSRQNLSSPHVSLLSSPSSGARVSPSPPRASSSFPSAMELLPSGSTIFQGSLLPRSSPFLSGRGERGFGSDAESVVGFPFCDLQLSNGEHQPRLVAEGLAEILLAFDQVERDEDLTYEQLLMLEATLLFGGMGLHDQHSDLRLDVDNMSYEELLALEERIGNVNTGLSIDVVDKNLKKSKYSSQAAASAGSLESDIRCSVCQEEYEENDELGEIDCGHSYHIACIRQWLLQKNVCPICKACAVS